MNPRTHLLSCDLLNALSGHTDVPRDLPRTHRLRRLPDGVLALKASVRQRPKGPLIAGLGRAQGVFGSQRLDEAMASTFACVWTASPTRSRSARLRARNSSGVIAPERIAFMFVLYCLAASCVLMRTIVPNDLGAVKWVWQRDLRDGR